MISLSENKKVLGIYKNLEQISHVSMINAPVELKLNY